MKCDRYTTLAEFRSFVMNNKAFGNLFCNLQKSFHTSTGSSTRIIEAIDHSSNSTIVFAFTKNPRIFCKCKCHCWVWRMIDSLYYSSRKVPGRCENSFVNYRINYQKLCDLMRQITKDLNWPTVCNYTLMYAHLNGIYQGWGVIATMNGIVYQPRELSDHLAMVGGYQKIHVWFQKNSASLLYQIMFLVLQWEVYFSNYKTLKR